MQQQRVEATGHSGARRARRGVLSPGELLPARLAPCLVLSFLVLALLLSLFPFRGALLSLSLSSLDDVNSTVVLREWATFSHVLLGWCSATHPSRKINIPRTLFYGKKLLNVPETTKIVLRFEFESHENIIVLWEG